MDKQREKLHLLSEQAIHHKCYDFIERLEKAGIHSINHNTSYTGSNLSCFWCFQLRIHVSDCRSDHQMIGVQWVNSSNQWSERAEIRVENEKRPQVRGQTRGCVSLFLVLLTLNWLPSIFDSIRHSVIPSTIDRKIQRTRATKDRNEKVRSKVQRISDCKRPQVWSRVVGMGIT